MERSASLSEARKQFYRDGFFGRLVVETTPTQARSYFPDEAPDSVAWFAWEVVERRGDDFVTRFRDEDAGRWVGKNVRLDGDCYRVEQPELGFGEWFCRQGP